MPSLLSVATAVVQDGENRMVGALAGATESPQLRSLTRLTVCPQVGAQA